MRKAKYSRLIIVLYNKNNIGKLVKLLKVPIRIKLKIQEY